MAKNRFKWSAMAAALVASSLASGLALAAGEIDSYPQCNNTIAQAQKLEFDGSGVAVINGTMVNGPGYNPCDTYTQNRDIDVYSMQANEGDDLHIAISGAWNGTYTWTVLGIYGPSDGIGHPLKAYANIGPQNPDGTYDMNPVIKDYHVNAGGTYYIAVSSMPGVFAPYDANLYAYQTYDYSPSSTGGVVGPYTLTVSGAAPAVMQIGIEIKPGVHTVTVLDASGVAHPATLRGTASGHLPVALLSSKTFDATQVDQSSLRFGASGTEKSLVNCSKGRGIDVNHDGRPDLLCHFDMKKANFALSETQGYLTGKTGDGADFAGNAWMKIVTLGLTPQGMGASHK